MKLRRVQIPYTFPLPVSSRVCRKVFLGIREKIQPRTEPSDILNIIEEAIQQHK